MSIFRARTGLETDGDRFSFNGVRPPPADALNPAGRKLATELAEHAAVWRAAKRRRDELAGEPAQRAARRADADLLGKAARNGDDLPGRPNEQQLEDDLAAAMQDMLKAEAVGRLVATDLDQAISSTATTQADTFRQRIADAIDEHAAALAALETARTDLIRSATFYTYWRGVLDGAPASWRGRPDGGGAVIRTPTGGKVGLAEFGKYTTELRQEAARIVRAIEVGDEAPAA